MLPQPLPAGWHALNTSIGHVTYCGAIAAAQAIIEMLKKSITDSTAVATKLAEIPDHYAVIAHTGDTTLAAVDHIRSIPLFWRRLNNAGQVAVNPNARTLLDDKATMAFDPDALREFAMTGYVTGDNTLIPGIRQLEAGEVRRWQHNVTETTSAYSYRHWPTKWNTLPAECTYRNLGTCIDGAFSRTMAKADGKLILVPLSGGLDSRLVLAKLVEKGYGPLQAFSYGPRHNPDAEIARRVATQLRVPWSYVVTTGQTARGLLGSKLLEDYWNSADGLSAVPNHQDLLPLTRLLDTHKLPNDVMVVNGQTGDFVTGGHIPTAFVGAASVTTNTLLEEIITKHYGLWRNLMTKENLSAAKKCIRSRLSLGAPTTVISAAQAAAFFELWEYRERQAKYVVNGQRVYDFLGLGWSLPLWDREFTAFWRDATLAEKLDQALYKDWLQSWDYRNVFTDISSRVTAWPTLASGALVPVALALRLVIGRTQRDRLFRYLHYFDRFGDHYKIFGFRTFARHAQHFRNPTSLYGRAWLLHHGVSLEGLGFK